MTGIGWFADRSNEGDRIEGSPWQPFVQVAGGCFPLPMWFKTQGQCESFILNHLIGLGMLTVAKSGRDISRPTGAPASSCLGPKT